MAGLNPVSPGVAPGAVPGPVPQAGEALRPLPPQPSGVRWPTAMWPAGAAPAALVDAVDELFADEATYGVTYAVAAVQGGRMLLQRHGGALPSFTDDPKPVEASTPLLSWSMAKSVLHCAVGMLVAGGRMDLDAPAPVPEWSGADEPRQAITLQMLLEMRDGLAWNEDYVDAGVSHVIEMLFGQGAGDVAGFAAARPLAHPPGSVFNYSSGTSNLIARAAGAAAGGEAAMRRLLDEDLFGAIGMRSATARFDEAGTFIGSSYVYATAEDWARFGLLALRDGEWDGRRVLPEGWIDHGRTVRSLDPGGEDLYGAHWWIDMGSPFGAFRASGYEGQTVTVVPDLDAVLVRLGRSSADQVAQVHRWRRSAVAALA